LFEYNGTAMIDDAMADCFKFAAVVKAAKEATAKAKKKK